MFQDDYPLILDQTLNILDEELLGIAELGKYKLIVKLNSYEKYSEICEEFGGKEISVSDNIKIRVEDLSTYQTYVTVRNVPFEMSDFLLKDIFSRYGTVSYVKKNTRDHGRYKGIYNGVRTVSMKVDRPIPSYLYLECARVYIYVYYKGQTKTCRLCGEETHFANECQARRSQRTNIINDEDFPLLSSLERGNEYNVSKHGHYSDQHSTDPTQDPATQEDPMENSSTSEYPQSPPTQQKSEDVTEITLPGDSGDTAFMLSHPAVHEKESSQIQECAELHDKAEMAQKEVPDKEMQVKIVATYETPPGEYNEDTACDEAMPDMMVEANEALPIEVDSASSLFNDNTSKTKENDELTRDLLPHEVQTQFTNTEMAQQQCISENANMERNRLLSPDLFPENGCQTWETENKSGSLDECDFNSHIVSRLERNIFSYSRKDEVEQVELESSCSFSPQITPGQRSGNDGHISMADDSDSDQSVTRTGKNSKKRRQRKSELIRSRKKSSH